MCELSLGPSVLARDAARKHPNARIFKIPTTHILHHRFRPPLHAIPAQCLTAPPTSQVPDSTRNLRLSSRYSHSVLSQPTQPSPGASLAGLISSRLSISPSLSPPASHLSAITPFSIVAHATSSHRPLDQRLVSPATARCNPPEATEPAHWSSAEPEAQVGDLAPLSASSCY